jgi:hypothetical protein
MGSFYRGWDEDPDLLTGGVQTVSRLLTTSTAVALSTSGNIRFTFFTPRKGATITKIISCSGGTAAGATPTLCRMGFYTVDASGNLTLACANDNSTTLWAGTNTEYERALGTAGGLPSSYTFQAGLRYAAGVICVSGATIPTLVGNSQMNGATALRAPTMSALLSGQTDLPTSIAVGTLAASAQAPWVAGVA